MEAKLFVYLLDILPPTIIQSHSYLRANFISKTSENLSSHLWSGVLKHQITQTALPSGAKTLFQSRKDASSHSRNILMHPRESCLSQFSSVSHFLNSLPFKLPSVLLKTSAWIAAWWPMHNCIPFTQKLWSQQGIMVIRKGQKTGKWNMAKRINEGGV